MPRDSSILIDGPEPVTTWEAYGERGGGEAYRIAADTDVDFVTGALERAKLRGRGGAGFPTAVKWRGVAASPAPRRFICCNAAEGEPGTFKDRYILRHNAYQVLEGLSIGVELLGAERGYFCIKAGFEPEIAAVSAALEDMRAHIPAAERIEIVLGPDEYLFGEEKALLEVVEGGLPLPRVFPPYIHGLYAGAYGGPNDAENNPTVVNNVETLAHVTHIVRNGPDWFRTFGTDDTPGTTVFTVSGDVRRPVVRERPLGLTLRELIADHAGGPREGRRVKAVFPGVADAVITPDAFDTPLSFDAMAAAGSSLGSAGFIVYDDTACMVQVAHMFSRFLHVESCNQCAPCKRGADEITRRLEALLEGTADRTTLDEIANITAWVTNGQRCYLATSEQLVAASILAAFPADFEAHVEGPCELEHDRVLPKIADYVEGSGFTFDERYRFKQPDWTYADEE